MVSPLDSRPHRMAYVALAYSRQVHHMLTFIPQNVSPGHISPDSPAKSLSVSDASSAQTSQAAELDRDQQQDVPHITVPVQSLDRSNTPPLTTLPSVVSPQADTAIPQTYSSGPSSPVIVVPPDGPEAGPQLALSYLQREDSNDSGGSTSFLTANNSLPDPTHLIGLSSSRAGKRNSINPGMSFNYEAMSKELNRKKSVSAPQSPSSPQLPTVDVGQNSSLADPQSLLSREQISEGLARRSSRKARTEAPASTPAVAGSMLSRSRSRTELSSSTDPKGPLLRQNTMLERLPPRMHSLKASGQDPEALSRRPSLMTSAKSSSLGRSSSDEKDGHKPSSSLSIDVEKSRAGYGVGKRPVSPAYKAGSPAHRVDVPRGIESGTDTSDGEREPSTKERTRGLSWSSSKEKETKKSRRQQAHLDLETKQSASQEEPGEDTFLNSAGDVDTEDESSPVERMSRSTFIAPAHPPIRFSVSGNGFQELLSQLDPRDPASFSALGELLKMNEDAESRNDAGSSATSLNPNGGAASNEGGRLSSPSNAATPTTVFGFSTGDNSSVTTIPGPSSQDHGDSFLVLDQLGTTNGVKSDLLQRQRSVRNTSSTSSSRSSSEKSQDLPASDDQRTRLDPNAIICYTDVGLSEPSPQFTVTTPNSATGRPAKLDQAAAVMKRLQDALQDTARRGMTQITLDQEFVQAVVMTIEQRRDENAKMKSKLDHIKVCPFSDVSPQHLLVMLTVSS
jgi:Rho-type GTPase-activating protein 1/2